MPQIRWCTTVWTGCLVAKIYVHSMVYARCSRCKYMVPYNRGQMSRGTNTWYTTVQLDSIVVALCGLIRTVQLCHGTDTWLYYSKGWVCHNMCMLWYMPEASRHKHMVYYSIAGFYCGGGKWFNTYSPVVLQNTYAAVLQ